MWDYHQCIMASPRTLKFSKYKKIYKAFYKKRAGLPMPRQFLRQKAILSMSNKSRLHIANAHINELSYMTKQQKPIARINKGQIELIPRLHPRVPPRSSVGLQTKILFQCLISQDLQKKNMFSEEKKVGP